MAQWAKVLVAKPYALRSISVTHMVGEDNTPPSCPLASPDSVAPNPMNI